MSAADEYLLLCEVLIESEATVGYLGSGRWTCGGAFDEWRSSRIVSRGEIGREAGVGTVRGAYLNIRIIKHW